MTPNSKRKGGFAGLGLPDGMLSTLSEVGYEQPSPIQAASIVPLLEGQDLIGMAQTGTGKTAAFALPILSKIDLESPGVQGLVLCPTRELALQVAEAFQTYAAHMRHFHVLPIYGGQDMRTQLRALRRTVHVIVATPGRLLDHLQRKTVNLNQLKTVVLDEADEMLRMGFIDDVEQILQQTKADRQVALFSATMPSRIKQIAEKYLKDPQEVRIKSAAATNENTRQYYWMVRGTNKLDALTRMLEVEDFDGMIIFVRTKNSTAELADKLNARGFSASPLNGDMNQSLRQRTVEQLKRGHLDIVVATDVAARGLDVDRVSHVINFDIPYDAEAYVHRIGRTGRAGRAGKAILFVAPRERRLLQIIEKVTRKKIEPLELPTRHDLIYRRSKVFKESVVAAIGRNDADFFRSIVRDVCQEHSCSSEDVAAALAYLLQKEKPLQPPPERAVRERTREEGGGDFRSRHEATAPRDSRNAKGGKRDKSAPRTAAPGKAKPLKEHPEVPMERFRLSVGKQHGVAPGEIVGAIANEAGVEGEYIGHIAIHESFSTIDLPEGMPRVIFQDLKRTRVRGQKLQIQRVSPDGTPQEHKREPKKPKKKHRKGKDKPKGQKS